MIKKCASNCYVYNEQRNGWLIWCNANIEYVQNFIPTLQCRYRFVSRESGIYLFLSIKSCISLKRCGGLDPISSLSPAAFTTGLSMLASIRNTRYWRATNRKCTQSARKDVSYHKLSCIDSIHQQQIVKLPKCNLVKKNSEQCATSSLDMIH